MCVISKDTELSTHNSEIRKLVVLTAVMAFVNIWKKSVPAHFEKVKGGKNNYFSNELNHFGHRFVAKH